VFNSRGQHRPAKISFFPLIKVYTNKIKWEGIQIRETDEVINSEYFFLSLLVLNTTRVFEASKRCVDVKLLKIFASHATSRED